MMNQLGIQKFLEKAKVGMELMIAENESYYGEIVEINKTNVVIKRFGEIRYEITVYYRDVMWHSLEG